MAMIPKEGKWHRKSGLMLLQTDVSMLESSPPPSVTIFSSECSHTESRLLTLQAWPPSPPCLQIPSPTLEAENALSQLALHLEPVTYSWPHTQEGKPGAVDFRKGSSQCSKRDAQRKPPLLPVFECGNRCDGSSCCSHLAIVREQD